MSDLANKTWAEKQEEWYSLRRQNNKQKRPYPGAPDMHFPLQREDIIRRVVAADKQYPAYQKWKGG